MNARLLSLALILVFSTANAAEVVPWLKKYDQATAESRKTSRPIFVDVYADWCHWCHKLDREVYADPKFVQFIRAYVPLKLDSEDDGEGQRLAEKYSVDGLPAMLVLDADGKLLNKLSGYKTTDAMIEDVERVQKLLDLEKKDPSNEEINFRIASEYIEREMFHEAETRFQRTVNSASTSPAQKEKAQFSMALTEYYQGRLNPSLLMLESYYKKYPDGASNEDALLLLSQIHIELKSNEKAVKYLREFMKKYPKSRSAGRARQVLTALEKECPTCQG